MKSVKVLVGQMLGTVALACCLLLTGCGEKPPEKPGMSYKTRAEHAPIRVDKEIRLSETESIKVVIVPGFPMGERCVIYTNERGNAMQCREVTASQQ